MQRTSKNRNARVKSLSPIEKIFGLTVDQAREGYARLTRREAEVARILATGRTNQEIAVELGISRKTLDIHRGNVFEKLKTKTSAFVANAIHLLDLVDSGLISG